MKNLSLAILRSFLLLGAFAAAGLPSASAQEHSEDAAAAEVTADTQEEPTPVPRRAGPMKIEDPRGEPELVVCSQNLNNYGDFQLSATRLRGLTSDGYIQKEVGLVERFAKAHCDIIAVQELLGKDQKTAELALDRLARLLRVRTTRIFGYRSGASTDPIARVGFLYAKDRAELKNSTSYARVELPKLIDKERPRLFSRGPLEAQFLIRGRGEAPAKTVSLINFHFKSKAGKGRDPAELEFETVRMQMAEGLRRVAEIRHEQSFARGETLLLLLGDRNSNFTTASAKILTGELALSQFKGTAPCRITGAGTPVCKAGTALPQRLFSVLTDDPQVKALQGTFQFEGIYSWLDDILMPAESLRSAWARFDREGDYTSGVVSEPAEASDHGMVWVALNW